MVTNTDLTSMEEGAPSEGFKNAQIRNNFIRKVYGILALQFAITFLIVCAFRFNESLRDFVERNSYVFWIAFGVQAVLYFLLSCCENLRRQVPLNYILLGMFTFAMGFMLGLICSVYSIDAVYMACGLTFLVCLSVSIFSVFTSFDFTKWVWIGFIAFIIFFAAGILMLFFKRNNRLQIIYASIGVFLFIIYLAMDTQMIVGGRKYEISPEEYILATIMLYIDIIQIFLFILSILGRVNK